MEEPTTGRAERPEFGMCYPCMRGSDLGGQDMSNLESHRTRPETGDHVTLYGEMF